MKQNIEKRVVIFALSAIASSAILFLLEKLFPLQGIFEWVQLPIGIILFFLSGAPVPIIAQWATHRVFSFWEFVSLWFLGILFSVPLLLTLEFIVLGYVYDWFPLADISILYLIAAYPILSGKTTLPLPPSLKHPSEKNLGSLLIAFVIMVGVILINILSYRALPDLDPYSWLFKYTYQFRNQHLDYIAERPLFGAITFEGTRLLNISVYTFFKYVIPFLFSFIVFPAWLVAQNFPRTKQRLIWLAFLFTSPVILLYGQTAMPQAPLIIISYFFAFFLLHSKNQEDRFFLFAAGGSMLLAFLYHPAAAIPLSIWAIATAYHFRKTIFQNKITALLVVLIFLTNLSAFQTLIRFVRSWTEVVIASIFRPDNINWLYPSVYRNIDHNLMGWGDAAGVLKFYAFHAGPIVLLTLFICLAFTLSSRSWRTFLRRDILSSIETIILFGSFLIFFAIAEIFPRFPNIALLPDRAWIFTGIFSSLWVFALIKFATNKISYTWVASTFLFATVIIGGALYINFLKRYLITPLQWKSAQWIETNLPKERLLLSFGHKNLLPVHANSRLIQVPSDMYCGSLDGFFSVMNTLDPEKTTDPTFDDLAIKNSLKTLGALTKDEQDSYESNSTITNKRLDLRQFTNNVQREIDNINTDAMPKSGLPLLAPPTHVSYSPNESILYENVYRSPTLYYTINKQKDKIYIYYSEPNKNNPYRGRPYVMTTWGMESCPNNAPFVFDRYPEKFKRVYDDHEEVIIWKVL